MALFCDASCLVKFSRQKGAHIIKVIPESYDISSQEQFIAGCAFSEISSQANSIFASTTSKANCFTWSFMHKNEQHAVILLTHHFLADIYIKFLHNARKKLNGKGEPHEILDRIWQLLVRWTYDQARTVLTVITFKKSYDILLDSSLVVYSAFDPSVWIGCNESEYNKIWISLMTDKCVLFIGDSPSRVSNAVFAAISLLAPLIYYEPFLAYTRLGDPRFADVINGSKEWRIVGTTNPLAAERCQQFSVICHLNGNDSNYTSNSNSDPSMNSKNVPYIIKISSKNTSNNASGNSTDDESKPFEARAAVRRQETKFLHRLEDVLNDVLENDPYSDLLHRRLTKDDLEPFSFSAGKKKGAIRRLTLKEIFVFLETKTFRAWREAITFRPALRDAFLSMPPEDVLNGRGRRELTKILEVLVSVADRYANDVHMTAVIKRHQHLAKKKLKSLQASK